MHSVHSSAGEGPVSHTTSFWGSVRDALRGTQQDYTTGAVGRAVMLLAVPMVLEMAMESVFAVVDVFFVGKLGPHAIATVGLTESMLTFVYALAMGLGIGATAMVARRVGEHDPDGASRSAAQALWLGVLVAGVIGVAGATLAPRLLQLMGAERDVVVRGAPFARVMLGGSLSITMLFLINAIFRGAGDAVIAMRTLWLANAINIALGPCLIFGLGPFPELGLTGAAIATTTGRGIGALFALSRLVRPGARLRVTRAHLVPQPRVMARLVQLSASGTFQILIGMASWVFLVRILSSFGSQALAGYTVAMRLLIFALLPSWGMSNAAATMVGQALGARNPARAEQAVARAGLYNTYFLGAVGVAFVLWAPALVHLFTTDPVALATGGLGLRIVAAGFPFYAWGMVLTQSFNGAGDTWTPTWINLFCFWLFEVPIGWWLAVTLGMGPTGVFLAITLAYASLAVVSGIMFRRGTWKLQRV